MITRSLDKAKVAWKTRDVEASRIAHMQESPEDGEHHRTGGQYIKSMVYGGLDGIITTFAVVAGVAGAKLEASIVLILGFANLIADGLSMAVGDYLSTKAEMEYAAMERKREEWEVDNLIEGEKKEMVELYMDKGITEDDANTMVDILSKYKDAFVDVMMVEELGILEESESPVKNALVTFFSFGIFGFVPLITYVLYQWVPGVTLDAFLIASLLTGITLFILGAVKATITGMNWIRAGLEMLLVGGMAAAAAYGIGAALGNLA